MLLTIGVCLLTLSMIGLGVYVTIVEHIEKERNLRPTRKSMYAAVAIALLGIPLFALQLISSFQASATITGLQDTVKKFKMSEIVNEVADGTYAVSRKDFSRAYDHFRHARSTLVLCFEGPEDSVFADALANLVLASGCLAQESLTEAMKSVAIADMAEPSGNGLERLLERVKEKRRRSKLNQIYDMADTLPQLTQVNVTDSLIVSLLHQPLDLSLTYMQNSLKNGTASISDAWNLLYQALLNPSNKFFGPDRAHAFDVARDIYDSIAVLDMTGPERQYAMGISFLAHNMPDSALIRFERAIDGDSMYVDALYGKAVCLTILGTSSVFDDLIAVEVAVKTCQNEPRGVPPYVREWRTKVYSRIGLTPDSMSVKLQRWLDS